MKITTLLALGTALLTVTVLNLSAYDIALSPRAAANQIKVVSGTTAATPVTAYVVALSQRAAASQITQVNGTEPLVAKCPVAGSPKFLVAAGDNAPTACCGMAVGKCSAMSACASSN